MKCGVNNVRRNIQFLIQMGSIILSGCAIESKYENEDEKLREYALQTQAAIREGLMDSNLSKGCFTNNVTGECEYLPIERERFKYVGEYIDIYMNDIDVDKLSTDAKLFYEDSLISLRVYNNMVDESKNDFGQKSFERLYEYRDEHQFLKVVMDYYGVGSIYTDYDPIEEWKDN